MSTEHDFSFADLLPPRVEPPMPEGHILAEMLDNAAVNRLYRAVQDDRIAELESRARELEASVLLVAERNEQLEDDVRSARLALADITEQRDVALIALGLRREQGGWPA